MSQYKRYSESFNVSKINIIFYSEHDRSFNVGEFIAKIYEENGVQYIGIFNKEGKNSSAYVRRSSFDYTLKITYQSVTKIVTFRFNKNYLNIQSYTTCFHSLDISRTKVDITKDIKIKSDGNEYIIGTIEFRTSDNYLYNYKFDVNLIKVGLTPTGDVEFNIYATNITGIYEIGALSKTEYTGEYTIKILETVLCKEKIVVEESYATEIIFKDDTYFEETKNDGYNYYYEYTGDLSYSANLEFEFQLGCEDGGIINNEDYFNNNVDISYIENDTTSSDNSKYEITYDKDIKYFKFVDNFEYESKTYTWVFYFKKGNKQVKYYITYDQSTIKQQISFENSYFQIVTVEVIINNYATIDVFLKNGNGNFMGMTSGKLEQMKENVVVKAINSNGREAFGFNYIQITSSMLLDTKVKLPLKENSKLLLITKMKKLSAHVKIAL